MKNKKSRHESSSENSEEESEVSKRSEDSSSESESEESSGSERRHKKKRKPTESSASESDSVEHKRSKKRKHKKKKKKHGKKKRRDESEEESDSEKSSVSEGEIIKKKKKHKRKHKHNKRSRSPSVSASDKEYSDAGEIRGSDREGSSGSEHPSKTYYQKDYPQSGDDYQNLREREVQRFYRGSSKDRRPADEHHERYQYSREHAHRYSQQEKYERSRERPRYEERGPPEEQYHQHRRPREEGGYHQRQHDGGGYNRYNPYEQKGPRRREFEPKREYQERHNAPEERYHGREYPDKRQQRYKEENFDRTRDYRRERPVPRSERPPSPEERPRSRPPPRDERHQERRDKYDERRERYEERRDDRRDRNEERRERRPEPPAERRSPKPRKSRFADTEEGKDYQWGKTEVKTEGVDPADKEKPNFGLSGKLTADANTVNGVVVKYTEPDDARQPKRRWRFYPFKGEQVLPILYIHRQSAFLMGRDKKVVDIHLEHPSVSKQHAALQYRATPFTRPDGSQGRRVRPYIIDLDSANGTFVNNKKIEARRYVELLERDVVKFGFSAREYVLLHENSKDDEQDDDHHDANAIGANVTTTEKIKQEKRAKQAAVEDGD